MKHRESIEIAGFEGGRFGRVLIAEGRPARATPWGEIVRIAPSDLLSHGQFGSLPPEDRACVSWLAERAAQGVPR